MMDLQLHEADNKNDAFTRILRFMQDADIVLTSAEDTILSRWIYCDVLLRQNKFKTDDIIEKIRERFGVSKHTAHNDIYKTQALFEATRKTSKTYLLNHTIEDLGILIERWKYDKAMAPLLPKLYAERVRAIQSLPDHVTTEKVPVPIVYISVVSGQDISSGLSFEQAVALLKLRNSQRVTEDIPYEDVT